ncbi:MAG: menaquinone-specific isochorismate synthase [Psychromonas sp.]|jgi:menaquinone-specific isochorismate synthase|uniref:isochorismate synthase n=1 Tax=Psychromonas sp. TaxID=1884585 RepID=UPI0039E3EDBC
MLTVEPNFNLMVIFICEQLQQFAIKQGDKPRSNLVIPLTRFDLLSLLKGQSSGSDAIYPRIYWEDKEHLQSIACFGAIEECVNIPEPAAEACYFGGLAFQQQGAQWEDFPETLFIRPALEFKLEAQKLSLTCHFNGTNSIEESLLLINRLQKPVSPEAVNNIVISRKDLPNRQQWAQLVESAIEYKALIPKVVLSRQTELICEQQVNQWDLISQWQQANPNSFHFAFQFSKNHAFIGCSPERLFSREKTCLKTEALAGTVNRGKGPREDAILLQSLLSNKKIDRENYLVQEFIVSNLKRLKAEVICSEPHVMQLRNVQHLRVEINAKLKAQTSDAQLLHNLHPTPAVGGSPKRPALQFINDKEHYNRGWYAGTVGYLRADKSDFSVAIRCALLSDKKIKLFAGAGIVTGSIAEQEWQELENKIHTILDILSV